MLLRTIFQRHESLLLEPKNKGKKESKRSYQHNIMAECTEITEELLSSNRTMVENNAPESVRKSGSYDLYLVSRESYFRLHSVPGFVRKNHPASLCIFRQGPRDHRPARSRPVHCRIGNVLLLRERTEHIPCRLTRVCLQRRVGSQRLAVSSGPRT